MDFAIGKITFAAILVAAFACNKDGGKKRGPSNTTFAGSTNPNPTTTPGGQTQPNGGNINGTPIPSETPAPSASPITTQGTLKDVFLGTWYGDCDESDSGFFGTAATRKQVTLAQGSLIQEVKSFADDDCESESGVQTLNSQIANVTDSNRGQKIELVDDKGGKTTLTLSVRYGDLNVTDASGDTEKFDKDTN